MQCHDFLQFSLLHIALVLKSAPEAQKRPGCTLSGFEGSFIGILELTFADLENFKKQVGFFAQWKP